MTITYDPNDYPLPLSDAQEAALLALGQSEVDAQLLNTMITGGENFAAWADLYAGLGLSAEEAAAAWNAIGTG